ncbi:SusC/RagA family TonB-linked outer membrane protein [Kriegella aquimaris]|uniref:TonB-linked outer membrane protein, SusC/RagA family n=1 Tax=Kriegella aquimaris TaxID=192904 RepID=A0A1G9J748_9FLAO|nr:SusC/RagA family TonB-linked outer membrane protein [Kriegella aquimaris]SDL33387.1 TonB-linked outer membrane protein, SusC/RagA family [Kriegella aquimaris]
MTKKLLVILALVLGSYPILAQDKTVSGTITDASDGSPLPGVNVLVQGTTSGSQTDFDGNYTIDASEGDVLVFSFLGMKSQSVTVGSSNTINVSMEEDASQLDEVVVTALGIKRKEKTLTYAQQTVGGDELTNTRDVNFVNSISGKAAGVEIRKSSSGPGGSTKIQIRGSKSLSGDSSPLFVIDGIPMVNNRGGQPGVWNGVDQGDGLSQLNPDDIESMSILKGANAAILYGSQGANGVVVITTKSGKQGTATVQVNSGITFESVIETPELQFRYGAEGGAKESWSYTKGDYGDNYVEEYFDTGEQYFNSVSVSGGNEKTQAYFSFANTTATGITPGNKYGKNNLTFKQSTKLFNDKVKVTSNIILAQEKTDGRNRAGYYNNPLTGLYWFPRNLPFYKYKDNYKIFDAARNLDVMNWDEVIGGPDHLQSNPYWLLNEESQEDKTNRVITSLNIEYDITEHFKFQVRGNYDYAVKEFDTQRRAGGNTTTVAANGNWLYEKYDDTSTYLDGILTYNNTFGDFNITALGGATYQKTVFADGVRVNPPAAQNQLAYANEFNFNNLLGPPVQIESSPLLDRREKQSMFANVTFGYKEMLFLDLAGRNDWASTLALTGNDSYFYPSVGLTVILSEMFSMPEAISFAKIRGSFASVGNEVPYNRIFPRHKINADKSVDFNTTRPFTDAKPEIIRTSELGLDMRFFQNRLGIDFTYYDINSQDQFIEIGQPFEDYTSFFVNAGEITNKGVEITLTGKPIVGEDFNWSTAINYSRNKNTIVELHPDTQEIGQGGSEGVRVRLVEGGAASDIYGFKFQRDDQGRIILDDVSGRPLKTGERELLGNAEPDYILGWSNTLNYKNFGLNMQINGKFGGIVVSQTEALLDGYGVSERSAVARDRGYENINAVQNGSAVTQIDPFTYYDAVGGRNGIDEAHTYDRTSIRLAQLALSYNFKISQWEWLKNSSVSLIGNNLFYFYKDAPYDPELSQATGRNDAGIDNFNLPSTRTIGLNLNLTF